MGKMPKKFDYDVVKLLNSIRDRPCLWNSQSEAYKDRLDKKAAWDEIFHILDSSYDSLTPEEKRVTGAVIQNKWTNIRDTFVRTLRKGDKQKRKYLLYDHIKFLIPLVSKFDRESEYGTETDDYTDTIFKEEPEVDPEPEPPKPKKKKKRVYSQSSEDKNQESFRNTSDPLNFIEVGDDPRIMNEDEAFFASLLPTVVKYNEDERLNFRLEVLNLMKRIRDDRTWNSSH